MTTVTDTVEIDPGGRYALSRSMAPAGDREPDPQAGQRVRLARGPHHDQVRIRLAQGDERRGRRTRRTPRRGPRSGLRDRAARSSQPGQERLDRAVGLRRPVGLFGLHSQTTGALAPRRARTPPTSSAQPCRGAEPRDGHDPRPRCSVTTRYIAYVGIGTTARRPPAGTPWRRCRGPRRARHRRGSRSGGRRSAAAAADEPSVVRRRVLGQAARRTVRPRAARRPAPAGPGDVFRSKRTIVARIAGRSARRPPRRSPPRCRPAGAVGERERDRASGSSRACGRIGEADLDGVAVGDQALGLGQGRDRRRGSPARPSR